MHRMMDAGLLAVEGLWVLRLEDSHAPTFGSYTVKSQPRNPSGERPTYFDQKERAKYDAWVSGPNGLGFLKGETCTFHIYPRPTTSDRRAPKKDHRLLLEVTGVRSRPTASFSSPTAEPVIGQNSQKLGC